jgi:hypothetical protein
MDEESVSNLNCRIPGQNDARTAIGHREHHPARVKAPHSLGMFLHLKTMLAGAKTSLKVTIQSGF